MLCTVKYLANNIPYFLNFLLHFVSPLNFILNTVKFCDSKKENNNNNNNNNPKSEKKREYKNAVEHRMHPTIYQKRAGPCNVNNFSWFLIDNLVSFFSLHLNSDDFVYLFHSSKQIGKKHKRHRSWFQVSTINPKINSPRKN